MNKFKAEQDFQRLAALITLVLGTAALVSWVQTWPSRVIPTTLTVIGAFAYTVIRMRLSALSARWEEASGVPRWVPRWEIERNAITIPLVLLGIVFVLPVVSQIIGGAVLAGGLFWAGRALNRRYSLP